MEQRLGGVVALSTWFSSKYQPRPCLTRKHTRVHTAYKLAHTAHTHAHTAYTRTHNTRTHTNAHTHTGTSGAEWCQGGDWHSGWGGVGGEGGAGHVFKTCLKPHVHPSIPCRASNSMSSIRPIPCRPIPCRTYLGETLKPNQKVYTWTDRKRRDTPKQIHLERLDEMRHSRLVAS